MEIFFIIAVVLFEKSKKKNLKKYDK